MKRPIVTDFTETIYRSDAYKYTQEQEKYIDYLEAQAEQLILSGVVVPKGTLCECGNSKPHTDQSHCQNCIDEAFTL